MSEDMIYSVCIPWVWYLLWTWRRSMRWKKCLFAADELTGLIWAAALMRPSKSANGHGGKDA